MIHKLLWEPWLLPPMWDLLEPVLSQLWSHSCNQAPASAEWQPFIESTRWNNKIKPSPAFTPPPAKARRDVEIIHANTFILETSKWRFEDWQWVSKKARLELRSLSCTVFQNLTAFDHVAAANTKAAIKKQSVSALSCFWPCDGDSLRAVHLGGGLPINYSSAPEESDPKYWHITA